MVAEPSPRAQRSGKQKAEPTPARRIRRVDRRPAPVVTPVFVRPRVVVAQAEEPDQPEDEQPNVEDPKADHEDPTLRAHTLIVPRSGGWPYLFSGVFRITSAVKSRRAVLWRHWNFVICPIVSRARSRSTSSH